MTANRGGNWQVSMRMSFKTFWLVPVRYSTYPRFPSNVSTHLNQYGTVGIIQKIGAINSHMYDPTTVLCHTTLLYSNCTVGTVPYRYLISVVRHRGRTNLQMSPTSRIALVAKLVNCKIQCNSAAIFLIIQIGPVEIT